MKILASDYDGTLRTGVLVDKKDRDAIVKFQKDGNHFGIVTGRIWILTKHWISLVILRI